MINNSKGSQIGYYLFLLYTFSFFIQLPERLPFLGLIRFDFILGIILLIISALTLSLRHSNQSYPRVNTTFLVTGLIFFAILIIPAVQWPGSVLRQGLPNFLKSIVFYIFAVIFITDESKLKKFFNLYFILLLFIILEPLFYYLKDGRLGYVDYSMGTEGFSRLAGTTSKVGGSPNGLASVVAITFPFIFFLFKYYKSKLFRLFLLICLPLSMVVLILTGSRSGLLATIVAVTICLLRGRVLFKGAVIMSIIAILAWAYMGNLHKERYLSMVDSSAKGRESAVGRIQHINRALDMFLERPFTGYGLGTYGEANYNINDEGLVSHNIYTEVLVELGIVGFLIFSMFLISIFKNIYKIKRYYLMTSDNKHYQLNVANILEAVLITQLAFSFFAGGLFSYFWYLIGGLSVVTLRIAHFSNTASTSVRSVNQHNVETIFAHR